MDFKNNAVTEWLAQGLNTIWVAIGSIFLIGAACGATIALLLT